MVEDVKRYVEARRDPLVEGGTPLSALVAKCAGQVVGVAVMREEAVRLRTSSNSVVCCSYCICFVVLCCSTCSISDRITTSRISFTTTITFQLSTLTCTTSSSTQSLLHTLSTSSRYRAKYFFLHCLSLFPPSPGMLEALTQELPILPSLSQ